LVVTGWLLLGDVVIQNIDLCFDTFCNWVRLCMWSVGTCCRCYKVLQVSLRAAGASTDELLSVVTLLTQCTQLSHISKSVCF